MRERDEGGASGARAVRRRARRPALALALAGLGSCAALASERHLAPVFTEISRAGGGSEIEIAGGALLVRWNRPRRSLSQWGLRPLLLHERGTAGDWRTNYLVPLGQAERLGPELTWHLFPVARYSERNYEGGELEWSFLMIPGLYWVKRHDGREHAGFFPFIGHIEDALTFDRADFVLWPLYTRTERAGRISHHVLFPVFAYTYGAGGPSGRFWPLYGRSRYEGRYDRHFVLWPIWNYQENNLGAPPEEQETKWMLWPFYGRTTAGKYTAHSVVWPLFGYAENPETGYRAWDAPWPLVRYVRDPVNDLSRTRVWPFYSHYHGDGLDSTWYLWPFVNLRHEEYEDATSNSVSIIPFWQSTVRDDDQAGRSRYHKAWPLYQYASTDRGSSQVSFPALNPLWRTPDVDAMYAWMWELYNRERDHELLRERTWLGLYRREKDEYEDRRSLAGLWAYRRYRAQGRTVEETSLLFGLLRWRLSDGDFALLAPALPGPGWPLARAAEEPLRAR